MLDKLDRLEAEDPEDAVAYARQIMREARVSLGYLEWRCLSVLLGGADPETAERALLAFRGVRILRRGGQS